MLRLLLLSDIHFLSLYEEMDSHAAIRKAFLKDLSDYRNEYGVIDHILVCGDIASKGEKNEYDAAYRFFEEICSIVDCKQEEIYIVPGNHDKNFNASNSEVRHLIHSGLANEKINSDKLFIELLDNNFAQFKALYQPFKDYQDFAVKMLSCEPLMTKCLDEGKDSVYDNKKDKAYMMVNLKSTENYPVLLYAMNTSLCSDWYDVNDFEKGHKLFLPKLSYNTNADREDCINIAMMHHPTSRLVNGEQIAKVLDEHFQIQIFGHLHKPVSESHKAVHIHSGALQPPKDENDNSLSYFSVYNILEIQVKNENNIDNLHVQLRVEKYDDESKEFTEISEESKKIIFPLKKHVNRWQGNKFPQEQENLLPDGITDRTVKYKFLQIENPKYIMRRMNYYYNDNVSHNMNCINFLNKIQSERRMSELWNVINQK